MPDYGTERWTQGVEDGLKAYFSDATQVEISLGSPLTPTLGGALVNLYANTGVSLGAVDTKEPWAQWLAHETYDSGWVVVYKVDALLLNAIGGTTVLPDEGGCGAIDNGASAVTNYGNPVSASTCGNPSWAAVVPPQQFDASSGTVDPCGCVPGGPTIYDVPNIYVACLRPSLPPGVPWTALPEAAIGWALLPPGAGDEYGVAAALVAAGLPPYMSQPDAALARAGLMPNRARPIGAL